MRRTTATIRLPMRRPALARVLRLVAAAIIVSAGCPAPDSVRDTSTVTPSAGAATADTSATAWYHRARALDLTGDGVLDTVRLDAEGREPDSLQLTLTLVVDGRARHEERWGSSYELQLVDTALRASARVGPVLRARLDTVLAGVRVESLTAPGVRIMAEDRAILATLEPPPTLRISASFGFETTVQLVWDAPRQRFVRLWSCC